MMLTLLDMAVLRDAVAMGWGGLRRSSTWRLRGDWRSPAFVDIPTGASMRLERTMARRKRRKFTDEFKADAVKLCAAGGRSVTQVAADLDLT